MRDLERAFVWLQLKRGAIERVLVCSTTRKKGFNDICINVELISINVGILLK